MTNEPYVTDEGKAWLMDEVRPLVRPRYQDPVPLRRLIDLAVEGAIEDLKLGRLPALTIPPKLRGKIEVNHNLVDPLHEYYLRVPDEFIRDPRFDDKED